MGYRRDKDPSPLRSGIVHAGLSLAVFGGLAGALGTGVHFSGDASDASPRATLALFENTGDTRPSLKARLKSETVDTAAMNEATLAALTAPVASEEADLGVDYDDGQTLVVNVDEQPVGQGASDAPVNGIRINGKLVRPGESLSQVSTSVALEAAPISGLHERVNGVRLPRIAENGRSPAEAYARPFSNPDNRPVVSLIVGGLGINARHTRSAIDELPPEVTLSFAPDARRLQKWVNDARAAGHEVMIEVPMEAHAYGRMKMHPQTLRADADQAQNMAFLNQILGKATGYFGVINYQGAKFADNDDALAPVLSALTARGIAFAEDGSLSRTGFDTVATETSLQYVKASQQIDAKLTATDINAQFLELETAALANGAAMGAGYAYPITIEMVKAWTDSLADKGLILAPVSAMTAVNPIPVRAAENETGTIQKASVDTAG